MKLKDFIPFAVFRTLDSLMLCLSTAFMRIYCFWWSVEIGPRCKFYGRAGLRRMPGSTIKIGSNSTFRSAFYSNTIGLKQLCFLSTAKGALLEIGSDCGFSGAVIASEKEIIIGNRVFLGANVTIGDADRHPLAPDLRARGCPGDVAPVIVEDDVWVGMNSVVLKGVTIGRGSVIGANSVVTKNIPPGVVAGGIPAKILKPIDIEE